MTREEWKAFYELKTGGKFYHNPEHNIEYAPDNSFMIWYIKGDYVWIDQTVGDGEYWRKFIFQKAREHKGLLKTMTRRNPRVFQRLWKVAIIVDELSVAEDGRIVWVLELEVGKEE